MAKAGRGWKELERAQRRWKRLYGK